MMSYLLPSGGSDERPLYSDLTVVDLTTIDFTQYFGITAASLPTDVVPLALSDNMAAHWYLQTANTTKLSIRDTAAGASYTGGLTLNYVLELATFDDANDLFFTFGSDANLRIYDTSQLASDTLPLLATADNVFNGDHLLYHNGHVYAGNTVWDVSTPSAPVDVGSTSGIYFGVHSSGNYAISYRASNNVFSIVDIQNGPTGSVVSTITGAVGANFYDIVRPILKSTNDRVAIYDTTDGHHVSCINWSDPLNPTIQFPRARFKSYFSDITLDEDQPNSNFITQSGDIGYLARRETLVFDLTANEFTILYRGNVSPSPGADWWVAASGNRVMLHPALDNATYYGNNTSTNTNP